MKALIIFGIKWVFRRVATSELSKKNNKNYHRVCRVNTHLYMKFEDDRSTIGRDIDQNVSKKVFKIVTMGPLAGIVT